MAKLRPIGDAARLKRGQRVSRKKSDASGNITEASERGVKVKWDTGETSYYTGDEQAGVRASTKPVKSLVACPIL